jgi:uncharacterized protein (DUF1778 family)
LDEDEKAMTTITIDITERQMATLTAKAKAQGLTLEDWFRQVAAREAESTLVAQKTDPEEWLRTFDAFVATLDPNTPVLSNEAMRRESIYPDRS